MTDVKDTAKRVAADIRTHGHFHGDYSDYIWDGFEGKCCVLFNSVFFGGKRDELAPDFIASLRKTLGFDAGEFKLPGHVVAWNDATPTEKILETLDKIAAGE